jgi:N-acetylglutamate synthase-like GNAT family acetyltransferase
MISNLRKVPHFADTVASRGWHAWWTDSGVPLADYRSLLNPMLESDGIPFCLVAHDGEVYQGSCVVIENDLDARPRYAPWIAALWVDPDHRSQGLASSLMREARSILHAMSVKSVYLCAKPKMTTYYLARGWNQIETDIAGLNVFAANCDKPWS